MCPSIPFLRDVTKTSGVLLETWAVLSSMGISMGQIHPGVLRGRGAILEHVHLAPCLGAGCSPSRGGSKPMSLGGGSSAGPHPGRGTGEFRFLWEQGWGAPQCSAALLAWGTLGLLQLFYCVSWRGMSCFPLALCAWLCSGECHSCLSPAGCCPRQGPGSNNSSVEMPCTFHRMGTVLRDRHFHPFFFHTFSLL